MAGRPPRAGEPGMGETVERAILSPRRRWNQVAWSLLTQETNPTVERLAELNTGTGATEG
ncbi:hypothetical protein QC764_0024110 [Podospora pseudoanserina]|uniref:Uncharacterized protein n=1 Tax=Podospora pseudoanserina TaxID=2609844 RepID=A0ABR0IRD6_9PEZI|nr:hypothetical protein QC764_0024110 [Podospora pseudoanserina]